MEMDSFFLKKTILKQGSGLETPRDGAVCNIKISPVTKDENSGQMNCGVQLNSLGSKFTIGETDSEFERIINDCLFSMKQGEIWDIQFSYSQNEKSDETSAEMYTFEGSLELESFTSEKHLCELSDDEKLKLCAHHKSKGVEQFNLKRTVSAFHRFSKGLKILLTLNEKNFLKNEEYKSLKVALYSNIAACQMTTGKYCHVVANCSEVLYMDSRNEKALYRRGTAYLKLQDYGKAAADLQRTLQLNPNNGAAKQQLDIVNKHIKQADREITEGMKKFFQ